MADEQQAMDHISAKLFYVSSQLASNKKNSQPEERLHGEFLLKEMHAYKPWRWRTIKHAKLAANRMVAGSGISRRWSGRSPAAAPHGGQQQHLTKAATCRQSRATLSF
jgi:hypothetical protein